MTLAHPQLTGELGHAPAIERARPDPLRRHARQLRYRVDDARPGASSGRQRRQGRKPSRSADAAVSKKRRRSGYDTRAGHTGRQ